VNGFGKTKILKEAIKKFGGEGRIAYINAKDLEKELNVEKVLVKKNGILGFMFKKYPKKMILLLDDVESMTAKNMERIKYFFDNNHLRAVIITTESYERLNLTEGIKQRIIKIVKLKALSEFEAVQVVRDKVGESVLTDRMIKEVYRASDKNMKKFLDNCEVACKAYVANKNIAEEEVKKMFDRGEK
jgi:predicted AAA+ superfamily ATPase